MAEISRFWVSKKIPCESGTREPAEVAPVRPGRRSTILRICSKTVSALICRSSQGDSVSKKEIKSKQKILEAAEDEFAEQGFAGARTQEIAKKAAVNKSLIHYYYKDKSS